MLSAPTPRSPAISRREWLQLAGGGAWLALAGRPSHLAAQTPGSRLKLPVAGVITVYQPNSHADVILGKILEGFEQDGGPGPDLQLASLFVDQFPAQDMSRRLAEKHRFRLAKTIDEALTLGTDKLQVAGVLSIGEHGNYPHTPDTQQHQYPRRRFLDEILATFERCKQVVPVFNDKHLAYNWSDAKHMYEAARRLNVTMLAGSSVPVAWREPPLQLPRESDIVDALVVGYGGLEAYGFHALEALQCMVERRRGGETGVAAVQAVRGDAIWEAQRAGHWSEELLNAALATTPGATRGPIRERLSDNAAFYLIEYRDGFRATVAMANGVAREFAFAARLKGQAEPVATWCKLQDEKPFGHFAYLVRAIDHTFHTGKAAYPVERTLLTTGVLDTALHSVARNGVRIETPELAVAYQASDWPFANQTK